MKARSAECRTASNASPAEIQEKARQLWISERRKVLIDTWAIRDDSFKQQVIKWADDNFKDNK